jgi:hypothetical protein
MSRLCFAVPACVVKLLGFFSKYFFFDKVISDGFKVSDRYQWPGFCIKGKGIIDGVFSSLAFCILQISDIISALTSKGKIHAYKKI